MDAKTIQYRPLSKPKVDNVHRATLLLIVISSAVGLGLGGSILLDMIRRSPAATAISIALLALAVLAIVQDLRAAYRRETRRAAVLRTLGGER